MWVRAGRLRLRVHRMGAIDTQLSWSGAAPQLGTKRITPSSVEQKLRTPDWFRATGTALTTYCEPSPEVTTVKMYPLLPDGAVSSVALSTRQAVAGLLAHGSTPPNDARLRAYPTAGKA